MADATIISEHPQAQRRRSRSSPMCISRPTAARSTGRCRQRPHPRHGHRAARGVGHPSGRPWCSPAISPTRATVEPTSGCARSWRGPSRAWGRSSWSRPATTTTEPLSVPSCCTALRQRRMRSPRSDRTRRSAASTWSRGCGSSCSTRACQGRTGARSTTASSSGSRTCSSRGLRSGRSSCCTIRRCRRSSTSP